MSRVTIRSLHVYPMKGCRAIDVDSVEIIDGRIVGDRTLMMIDAAAGTFVSQRHLPSMARLVVDRSGQNLTFEDHHLRLTDLPPGPRRQVNVWGDVFDAQDLGDAPARVLSKWFDRDVRLVKLPTASPRAVDPFWTGGRDVRTSFADLAPVLVTNTASLDKVNRRREQAGEAPIPMARFRPGIVVEGFDAFEEDRVRTLSAPGVTIELVKPCARCKVIELDPITGDVRRDGVLEGLASFRTFANARGTKGVMFGQNAIFIHETPVRLSVGAELTIG
ncbi:MAG: MOSC domain-containing protein [Tepidisphaeraceae bacterium]